MLPYYVIIGMASFLAISEKSKYTTTKKSSGFILLFFIADFFFVGFRLEVGSDWYNYLGMLEFTKDKDLFEVFGRSEPGYILINWVSTNVLSLDSLEAIIAVNITCSAISIFCIYKFCVHQNRPGLAAYLCTCYFTVVVVMGLTRQGTAASITFFALILLFKGRPAQYVLAILFAAMFHFSALILLPLAVLSKRHSNLYYVFAGIFSALLVGVISALSFGATVNDQYFDRELSSGGAGARFMFHISASFLFIVFSNRFRLNSVEFRVYFVLSWMSFIMLSLLVLIPSSTFVDRLAFYITPLQLFVFSNFPNIVLPRNRFSSLAIVIVMSLFLAKFSLWIVFGNVATRFLPYSNFLM